MVTNHVFRAWIDNVKSQNLVKNHDFKFSQARNHQLLMLRTVNSSSPPNGGVLACTLNVRLSTTNLPVLTEPSRYKGLYASQPMADHAFTDTRGDRINQS